MLNDYLTCSRIKTFSSAQDVVEEGLSGLRRGVRRGFWSESDRKGLNNPDFGFVAVEWKFALDPYVSDESSVVIHKL